MPERLLHFLFLVLCLTVLVTSTTLAQVTTGTLYGRVVDQSGGVIPGADVTITNEETSASRSTVTNERGEFTLTFLNVGTYTCTVSMTGFKTREETGIEVSSGKKLNQVFSLEVGEVTETLTVTSEAALVQHVHLGRDSRSQRAGHGAVAAGEPRFHESPQRGTRDLAQRRRPVSKRTSRGRVHFHGRRG